MKKLTVVYDACILYPAILANYGVYAIHPDEFILELIDISEIEVIRAINQQKTNLKKPPLILEKYLECLENQGLIETVSVLRKIL